MRANIHSKGILQFLSFLALIMFIGCGGNQSRVKNTPTNPQNAHSSVLSTAVFPLTVSPLKKHHQEIRLLSWFLNDFHLAKPRINDEFSVRFFDVLLSDIDPEGTYFTQLDIEQFESVKWKLDDSISFGYLAPVFQIYSRKLNQHKNQMDYYLNKLADGSPLVLSGNSPPNSKTARWARNQGDLEILWTSLLSEEFDKLKRVGKTTAQAKALLTHRYQAEREVALKASADDIFNAFSNSFIKYIDPHSAYFSPRSNFSKLSMKQPDMVGIGMVLSKEGLYAKVAKLVENGPANQSGKIANKDKITAIETPEKGYQDVVGWRLDDIISLIRGKADTKIKLFLKRDINLQPFEVTVNREKVELKPLSLKSEIRRKQGKSVLVVNIPKFYTDFQAKYRGKPERKLSADLKRLIAVNNESVDAMVINLQDNSGGAIIEAVNTAGLFVGKKTIVKQRDTKGKIANDKYLVGALGFNKPIIVMVNGNSAGAAEIFAAALQDYGDAIIVGQTTHGMGTVQSVLDLNHHIKENNGNFGALKLTIAEYYRVTGKPFQRVGVQPDIIFSNLKHNEDREIDKKFSFGSKKIELSPVVRKDLSAEVARLKNKLNNRKLKTNLSDIEKAIELAFMWLGPVPQGE